LRAFVQISWVKNLRALEVHRGFLDHERTTWINRSRLAEMFDVVERLCGQPVDSDAVLLRVNHSVEFCDQAYFVRFSTDDLEDRLLYAVAVPLTDLGNFT